MKFRSIALATLTGLACLLSERAAWAFEDQWHLGAGLGAVNASPSAIGLGIGVNAFASYGLSDMFDLKLDLKASNHPVDIAGTTQRHTVTLANLGIAYKIDIIEWIPFFGLQAGYLSSDLPEGLGLEPRGFLLGGFLGIDYAINRSFGLGVTNAWHFPVQGASLVDLFLRAEYRWGW